MFFCGRVNKDEDNSPKTLTDKNHLIKLLVMLLKYAWKTMTTLFTKDLHISWTPCFIASQTLKVISQVESFLCPDKQGTSEKGRMIQRPKRCEKNNKDEDNSPQKLLLIKIIKLRLRNLDIQLSCWENILLYSNTVTSSIEGIKEIFRGRSRNSCRSDCE